MTRAVLVGTNAYPFLIIFWLELAKRYWINDVDKIYIAVSEPAHESPWLWTRKYLEAQPKVKLIYTNTTWPKSINTVARTIEEDTVCLMHDDQFVIQPGVMDRYFKLAEEGERVITEMHPIYTPKDMIEELMVRKYPNQTPVQTDTGTEFSFYVNFTFLKTKLMHRTSMDFGEYNVPIGQKSEHLDWTPKYHPIHSDTNFLFNLELYQQGATITPLKRIVFTNYIQEPYGIQKFIHDYRHRSGMFEQPLPYIHLQTMAYHIAGLCFDAGEREKLSETSGREVEHKLENEASMQHVRAWRQDKQFKLALIQEFMSATDYEGIAKYYKHTKKELQWIQKRFGFDKHTQDKLKITMHELFYEQSRNTAHTG